MKEILLLPAVVSIFLFMYKMLEKFDVFCDANRQNLWLDEDVVLEDKEESAEQVIGNYLSASEERNSRLEKLLAAFQRENKVLNFRDLIISVLILLAASVMGYFFNALGFANANIMTLFVFAVQLIAVLTNHRAYSMIASVVSVLIFNFCFTEPRLTLHAYERGYPVTFAIMLIVSIITVTLAIQNIRNAEEKERAAVRAKNEQLRADLLRTISHDLRTPLTSISGNASNLISNYEKMDDPTRKQTFLDIYDDSMWLINLVENLLSITRLVEGRLNLNITEDLVDDVVAEHDALVAAIGDALV